MDLLDEIGFAWKADAAHQYKPDDKLWHQQYEKLLEYKRINGNCKVPQSYEQDKSLGKWVAWQRTVHIKNNLRQDRKRLLDELDFVWKVDDDVKLWHQQYEKLVEFKRKSGHCMLPRGYKEDKALGRWVAKQRHIYGNDMMLQKRKDLLEELRFTSNLGLPSEALKETEPAQPHVTTNRYECPSPDRKRSSTCLAERVGKAASTNQRDKATGSCSSVETDYGLDERDANPSLATSSSALVGSNQEATPESGQKMAATTRTKQRGKATGSCSSFEEDGGGLDEVDSKPSLVTSSAALIDPLPDQEVIQEEEARGEIPSGWKVHFPFEVSSPRGNFLADYFMQK
jgi:hypothetical protein